MNIDNRMGWCINIDKLEHDDMPYSIDEYELASDSYIPGIFDYRNGKILCGLSTFTMDSNGMYKYLLKIKFAGQSSFVPPYKKATNKGYAFKDGVPGELISIFSLYFQCRFFLIAAYFGDLTATGLKVKQEFRPHLQLFRPYFDPSFYPEGNRNFGLGLSDFLDQIKRIDAKYHQQIVLACFHYARALREFGIDEEMVFIRLVSAVEAVSGYINLNKRDDLFSGRDFEEIIKSDMLSVDEKIELNSLFDNRKAKRRFKRFFELYSGGFFKGGNFKAPHTRVKKADLSRTLDAIYDSRSDYLHNGEAMFLSSFFMKGGEKWDQDIFFEIIIDRRKLARRKKLPYSSFFQRLVRYCLMAYIKEISVA
jgi:hypothetical protein